MKFVIISYYTKGTRYRDEAISLIESLKRLNRPDMLYDIRAVDNLGSWQKNTHYKAEFILEMITGHDMPVLYVDADAIFHRYPSLIEQLECNVAAHFFQGHQLASGTLFFNNTPFAKEILYKWIKYNTGNTSALDQANLQDVLNGLGEPNFTKLPPEYCAIFDLMPEVKDPVIEHFQASRRLRNDATLSAREKEKYTQQWKCDYQPSACARPLDRYIKFTAGPCQKLLDIGCGNGLTVGLLRTSNYICHGVDITLAGITNQSCKKYGIPGLSLSGFYESPVWQMPFSDKEYDYTFSTDVLEHLPEDMVDAAIQEIYRVTRFKTFHCITTWPHNKDGIDLHLTVKPIEWWQEKFANLNTKGVHTRIITRDEFLKQSQTGFVVHENTVFC